MILSKKPLGTVRSSRTSFTAGRNLLFVLMVGWLRLQHSTVHQQEARATCTRIDEASSLPTARTPWEVRKRPFFADTSLFLRKPFRLRGTYPGKPHRYPSDGSSRRRAGRRRTGSETSHPAARPPCSRPPL